MLGWIGHVPLPRRIRRADGVLFHPPLCRGVGLTELLVRTAVHGHHGRTGRKLAGFDLTGTSGGCRHVKTDLDSEQAWTGREIPRERVPRQRDGRLLGVHEDLADALPYCACE